MHNNVAERLQYSKYEAVVYSSCAAMQIILQMRRDFVCASCTDAYHTHIGGARISRPSYFSVHTCEYITPWDKTIKSYNNEPRDIECRLYTRYTSTLVVVRLPGLYEHTSPSDKIIKSNNGEPAARYRVPLTLFKIHVRTPVCIYTNGLSGLPRPTRMVHGVGSTCNTR